MSFIFCVCVLLMQEALTCQEKNATILLSGCGIQLVSKKGLLTRTPALHLLSTHAGESSSRFTLSSSSSSSSSSVQDQYRAPPQPPQREREVENFPPRRPLKLAPLELPAGAREGQGQKIKPVEARARTPKVCWNDPSAKSPERYPLSTIAEPLKPRQRVAGALLLPVNQLKLGSDRSGGEEAGRGEGNPTIKSHPSPLCPSNTATRVRPARAPENASQSAAPDAVKRRMRLRRTNRLEEDQSKSSSSTGGLSADEGKTASAGLGKGQGTGERRRARAGKDITEGAWGI